MTKLNCNYLGLPTVGFVRLPQILHLIPIGKSTWWAGVKAGKYPKPVKISRRCTAWKVEDVRKLISSHDNVIGTSE